MVWRAQSIVVLSHIRGIKVRPSPEWFGSFRFMCKVCGTGHRCPVTLRQHTRIHTDERPFKCHYCPIAFHTKSQRTVHERIHTGIKPYLCRLCKQPFRTSSSRADHEKNVHNPNRQQRLKRNVQNISRSRTCQLCLVSSVFVGGKQSCQLCCMLPPRSKASRRQ